MKRGNQQHEIVAAAATEVALVDGVPARHVKLLPIGKIEMRDGRGPFLLRDRAHAEQVVAATRKWLGGADFNWDYNHQILAAGSKAVASGWTKKDGLTVEDDGIYADVEWTKAAAASIVDLEFRYISPLFAAARGTGEVLYLKNSALVNVGAIDLPAVIAAGLSGEEDDMSFALIAAALGLAATATEQECVAAATSLKSTADAAPSTSSIAIAAGLAETAGVEEIAASVAGLKAAKQPDLSGYVPKAVVEPIQAQLKELTGERLAKKVDDLIAAGIVIPEKRKETLAWFTEDEVAATAFFKDMPAVVPVGNKLGGKDVPEKKTQLDAADLQVAAAMGLSPKDYLAAAGGAA